MNIHLVSPFFVNDTFRKKNNLFSCYKSCSVGLKYQKVLPSLVCLNVTKNFAETLKRDKFKAMIAKSYIQKLHKERDSKLRKKKTLKLNNISYNHINYRGENGKKNHNAHNVSKIFLELKLNSEIANVYACDQLNHSSSYNNCFRSLNVNRYHKYHHDRNIKQNKCSCAHFYNSSVSNETNSFLSSSFSNALLRKKMLKSFSAKHF